MTVLTVGPNSAYATLQEALLQAGPNDTVDVEAGYGGETATASDSGLTVDAEASSTGLVVQLATGVSLFTLAGEAAINVFDSSDANSIVGNAGNNVITVTDGADTVNGGMGVDRLVADYRLAIGAVTGDSTSNITEAGGSHMVTITAGTFEHFTILTGSGADTITTGSGDDIINTGEGVGTVTAGQGANIITGGASADTITALDGGNNVDAGNGANIVTTGSGVDFIRTGVNADTISAGGGADTIVLRGGADTVHGEGGLDRLVVDYSASLTAVTMNAPTGSLAGYTGNVADLSANSVSFDGAEQFTIIGGSANDIVTTGAGDDFIEGAQGADRLAGQGGRDILSGGAGDDSLAGGEGDDVIDGGLGLDFVEYRNQTGGVVLTLNGALDAVATIGGTEFDTIRNVERVSGSSGTDILTGDGLSNYLIGFTGDDLLKGGGGVDTLDGGVGSDVVDYSDQTGHVSVTLNGATTVNVLVGGVREDVIRNIEGVLGGSAADVLYGDGADNVLRGNAGADLLRGYVGDDQLFGGDHDDILQAGAGEDLLFGGSGADKLGGGDDADLLEGGVGNDSLSGEGGADTFVFSRFEGIDAVRDFESADTIAFRATSFGLGGLPGDPAPVQFGIAAVGGSATFVYNAMTKTLFWDADGDGAAAAERLAILTTTHVVDASDFILI